MPRKQILPVAVAVLTLTTLTTLAAPAGAAPPGAPVRGTLAGSGSSSVDFVAGHPYRLWESDGTFRSTFLGRGTYHLRLTDTGTRRGIGLTVTTHAGTLTASMGTMGQPVLDAPVPVTGGTGRFAHATGSLTVADLARTNVVCIPPPIPGVPPDLFCDWDETATLTGAVAPH